MRQEGVVVAHPDVRAPHLVLAHDLLDPLKDVHLTWQEEMLYITLNYRRIADGLTVSWFQIEQSSQFDVLRDSIVGHGIQRLHGLNYD